MLPAIFPETVRTASNSAAPRKNRKVRSACERCRHRRIKCDGRVPACGNCSKVGALCVDVDGSDQERRIIRGFSTANASARIAWLEDIIRTGLPHINLDDGPQFPATTSGPVPEGFAIEWASAVVNQSPYMTGDSITTVIDDEQTDSMEAPPLSTHSNLPRGEKRQLSSLYDSSDRNTSVEDDTRSVALDLGLLSLNSESRQVHYLGSSSGSLFASLFQARKGGENLNGISPNKEGPRDILESHEDNHHSTGNLAALHLEQVRKPVDKLYAKLQNSLPPRAESDVLLNRFFQHMHPNHPFIHRPSFEKVVDSLYQCASNRLNSLIQYNGWPSTIDAFDYNGEEYVSYGHRLMPISAHVAAFQLLIALSIGATLQIRSRKYTHNPTIFFKSAISLAEHVFGTISLPVLQAVLLLILHSLITPEGCDVWVLTHIAMAHAIDLGLHREIGSSGRFTRVAVEMRRRIFFCVYSLDRSISTIQGRPLGLGDNTFDVHLPTINPFYLNSPGISTSSSVIADNATMSYSIQIFKMAQYVSKIKVEFYHLPNDHLVRPSPDEFLLKQKQLREELSQWLTESSDVVLAALPSDQRLRLSTKLNIQFHSAMCLLHQPSQAIIRPNDEVLQICFESATQRIRLYETLYESGTLCHSWRTVQDMFLAGATVMYCVCMSSNVRRSVSLTSLARDFRSCSSMLSVGGEWWPMIRNARSSLERLASHTLELFAERQRSGLDPSPAMPSLQVDATSSNFSTFNNSEGFTSSEIEEALASVLNHDGQLGGIFYSAPIPGFMDEVLIYDHDSHAYADSFCPNFDETEFANSTRQSRNDGRDLQDFIDNLGVP